VDVLEQTLGAILVTLGLWIWSPPVAVIVFGVMLALHGFLRELRSIREKESADGSRGLDQVDNTARDS
jgi:hypothetical protein